jgi:hypothetical protein
MQLQGVSRARSTNRLPFQRNPKLRRPIGKEQIHQAKLNPHYVVGFKDMTHYLFPFLDHYSLQAKKSKVYRLFKKIVTMYLKKKHLTDSGYKKIIELRNQIRSMGKKSRTVETARIRENRSSGGVGR